MAIEEIGIPILLLVAIYLSGKIRSSVHDDLLSTEQNDYEFLPKVTPEHFEDSSDR